MPISYPELVILKRLAHWRNQLARPRVFRTRVTCPGITADLSRIVSQTAMVGQVVTLALGDHDSVALSVDGVTVGELDADIASKVAAALARGQTFTAVVERATPIYKERSTPLGQRLEQMGASLDLKVEYVLEAGNPAIETKTAWRCVPSDSVPHTSRSFFTKVAGVTYEGRQEIVGQCHPGERLLLVREPDNPIDPGAVKVMRMNGQQLGYIPAHVTRNGDRSGFAHSIDDGETFDCYISEITGGGDKNFGVNIRITEVLDNTQTSMAQPEFPVAHLSTNQRPQSNLQGPADGLLAWIVIAAAIAMLITYVWFDLAR